MFTRLQTLGGALGAFGRSLIERAQEVGRHFGELLQIVKPVVLTVEPRYAAREWEETWMARQRKETFGTLWPSSYVPADWFEESTIPWKMPVAYKTVVYGKDLLTGELRYQEYDIPVSRALTVEEIFDETRARLGMEGETPKFEIYDIKLIGAMRRMGEAWRW